MGYCKDDELLYFYLESEVYHLCHSVRALL
jgi:hypothetical protein